MSFYKESLFTNIPIDSTVQTALQKLEDNPSLISKEKKHLSCPNKMVWFTGFPACECGKVYISETGRPMQDRIKQRKRDIRFARTQTSTVSEHANNTGQNPLWSEVKFFDRDPHWYTCRVKEEIHMRLHPNNINRDSGIEISESWMPTIKIHNS